MKVLIATPTYDGTVTTEYLASLTAVMLDFQRKGVKADLRTTIGTLVEPARNFFATLALSEGYTHLLFVDSDMGFSPSAVEKMLAFDRPFVGCIYPRRTKKQAFVGDDFWTDRGVWDVRGDFVRALSAGTGLLLLQRSVLAQLRTAHPELAAPAKGSHYEGFGLTGEVFQVFRPMANEQGIFGGEDTALCKRWTDLGGEIWCCYDETVKHVGREVFEGNFANAAGMSADAGPLAVLRRG